MRQEAAIRVLEKMLRDKSVQLTSTRKQLKHAQRVKRIQVQRVEKMKSEKAEHVKKSTQLKILRTADAVAIARGEYFLEGEESGWLTAQGVIALAHQTECQQRRVCRPRPCDSGRRIQVDGMQS